MINLLPPLEKEELLLEKKKKMIIILWLLVLFFLSSFALVLFSIKFYLQTQIESQKGLLVETEQQFGQSEVQELRDKINSANLTLTKLNSFYQQKVYFYEILERVSKTLPQEIYLTNLSAVSEEDGIKVSLFGFAPTVDVFVGFKENLEEEKGFKDIRFPASNWVKLTDIDFSVTFKIEH